MNCNVGKVDRTIRIIAGLTIIGVGVYYNDWWGAIGAVPLITALIGWCPGYSLIGVSTCGVRDKL
jgi:hypothetical protein